MSATRTHLRSHFLLSLSKREGGRCARASIPVSSVKRTLLFDTDEDVCKALEATAMFERQDEHMRVVVKAPPEWSDLDALSMKCDRICGG